MVLSRAVLSEIGQPERALVCALFLCLAVWFPYFEEIHSANELSRLYLTTAIVEEGSIRIDGPLKRLGNIHDKSIRDGQHYSDKAPGTSMLAVPVIWLYYQLADAPNLGGAVRLARLWVSTMPTAIFLLLLIGFLREHIEDRWLVGLLVGGYALGSLCTTYSILLYGHQLSAVLVFGAFLATRGIPGLEGRALWWRGALCGFLAAAAVCVEYQNALFLLPIGALFVWYCRRAPGAIVAAVVGALPFAILLGAYHEAAFGSPFKTGYSFLASHFKEVHEQGFMGIGAPKYEHLRLSLWSSAKGVLFFAPWLLLAPVGAVLGLAHLRPRLLRVRQFALGVDKRGGADLRLSVLMVALYVVFVSSMIYPDGGWTVAQRHLTPLVPWLLLPIGLTVSRWPLLRGPFAGLLAASVILTGLSTVVWPHYQEQLKNPFFQIGWPLFEAGFLPPSRFAWLGISTKTGVYLVGGLVAVALVWDQLRRSTRYGLRILSLGVAAFLCWAYLSAISALEREQPVERDLRWIQTVYHPDPLRPPDP